LIKIGLTQLTFLSGKKTDDSSVKPLFLTGGEEGPGGNQRITTASTDQGSTGARRICWSCSIRSRVPGKVPPGDPPGSFPGKRGRPRRFPPWKRTNKVLFVLYEISRQLNSIPDFNELLRGSWISSSWSLTRIFGFLILTGEKEDELIRCRQGAR